MNNTSFNSIRLFLIFISTFSILIILGFTISCNKNENLCIEVQCQNGGNCIDGTCNCPIGFSGQNCEIDICENIICDEPKICLNGECVCPIGYTGNDCSEEVFPTNVTVKEIIITDFPSENTAGFPWDDSGNPDLAVAIYDDTLQLFLSGIKSELAPTGMHAFSCYYTFSSGLLDKYYIPITEWDDQEYEIVGEMILTPYQEGMGFPDTVAIYPNDTTQTNLRGKVILSYGF